MAEALTIARLGHRGDGVAEGPDGPIFVAYALAGERVEAERIAPDRARLIRVLDASPDRVAPFCIHAGRCGGCAVQHLAPDAALEWKRSLVLEALRLARIEADVAPTIDAHGAGRRRATFHASSPKAGPLRVGFAEARAHALVDLTETGCPILVPALAGAAPAVRMLAGILRPLGKPLDALVTATSGGLDIALQGSGPPPERMRLALVEAAGKADLARLSVGNEVLVERRPPSLRVGPAVVVPPPGAFLQATTEGEAALGRLVLAGVGDARRIADLFSGCGTFALRLAERATVHAVESARPALAALERGARHTPGLRPVTTEARDLFRRPLSPAELAPFGAVVFDPPRAGAEAQARALAGSRVRTIVAVSCNAATFARDVAILTAGGFRLASVTPVDQFCHSAHVEMVGVLTR